MTQLTVRSLLFGSDGQTVIRTLESAGILASVTEVMRSSTSITGAWLAGDLGKAVAQLLDIDVGGLIAGGWRTHRAMQDAARITAQSPDESRTVVLARHTITSVHEPSVEVLVDERVACVVTLKLEVTLDIDSVTAVVERGRLTAFRCGRSRLSANLTWRDKVLAKDDVDIDVAVVLPLGEGIPLLAEASRHGDHRVPQSASV
jgi:hypothetical protein